MRSRLSLLLVVVFRVLIVVIWFLVPPAVRGQDCSSQEAKVTGLRSIIKRDEDSIQRLNPSLTGDELSGWTDAAEQERKAILKSSLDNAASILLGGLADKLSPGNALKPMDIAGYHLPNGIASLGTGQANSIIGNLQRSGVSGTVRGRVLTEAIRDLSSISNKRGTLQFLDELTKTAKVLKGAAEIQNSDDSVEAAGVLLQVVAGLAGKGGDSVALGVALFQGGKNEFDAYLITSVVGKLGDLSESQLDALKLSSAKLQRDVKALQDAKSQLDACTHQNDSDDPIEGSWTQSDWSNDCNGYIVTSSGGEIGKIVRTGPIESRII